MFSDVIFWLVNYSRFDGSDFNVILCIYLTTLDTRYLSNFRRYDYFEAFIIFLSVIKRPNALKMKQVFVPFLVFAHQAEIPSTIKPMWLHFKIIFAIHVCFTKKILHI